MPWGAAIDFRRQEVRAFFIDNALLWLLEHRFDGLRFHAAHAIGDRDFLRELASSLRGAVAPDRHVHLVRENDENHSDLLRAGPEQPGFDAQWSDDAHHALRVLLLLLEPQIPLLFMGEEWGGTCPFLFLTDRGEKLAAVVRQGRRREFSRFAAFADPAARAQCRHPNDPTNFLCSLPTLPAERTAEQAAWLACHARLLALRATFDHPRRDLMHLLACEGLRHRGVILAEDLGAVPPGVSDRLVVVGLAGLRALWFERTAGGFRPPESWPEMAATMTYPRSADGRRVVAGARHRLADAPRPPPQQASSA